MRRMTFGRRVAGALLLAGLAGTAAGLAPMAPASAQMNPASGIALDEDTVVRFIASYREMLAEADTLRQKYEVPDGQADPGSAFLAFMAYRDAIAPLNAIATDHGFGDFGQWVQVLTSVAMSYAFAKDGGAADSAMTEAIQQIRDNPQIPAAQKEMLIQQLEGGAMAMGAVRPPQENIDAVAGHVDELKAIFDN